jgi:hypothetical protein
MYIVIPVRTIVAACIALVGVVSAAPARAQASIGGAVVWPWPVYGPYAPYPYWGYTPWGPCVSGVCADDLQLRRAVRREMQLQELRRELEMRADAGFPAPGQSIYGLSRNPPPPTPESHLQPRYRGSGEVRPEYRSAGQAR